MTQKSVDLPPIEELIPHAGDSILLDRVMFHDRLETAVRVVVGDRSWLRRSDGSVASSLAVEYMAQCVAAHEGMLARADGRTLPPGFLVSVTRLRLDCAEFRFGERLRVTAKRLRGRPGLGVLSHHCEIYPEASQADAAPVASGRLSIVVPRDASAPR